MKFKKNGGFTLVELIVVIAILAILAGIAVPAYSGYISKANEAADHQLLGAVNTAFAAACLENNVPISSVTDAEVTWSDKKIVGISAVDANGITSATVAGINSSFKTYYGDNMNSAFKVIEDLSFDGGVFTSAEIGEYTYTLSDGTTVSIKFSQNDIQNLKDSTFMNATGLGVDGLLTKISEVTTFAQGLMGEDGNAFAKLMGGPDYLRSLATYMGIDVSNMADADLESAIAAKSDEKGWTEEQQAAMMANSAVLYAAQNATMDKSSVTTLLTKDGAKQEILKTLNGDAANGVAADPGAAMSQAALAYGMYTAYVHSLPDDFTSEDGKSKQDMIDATSDPMSILNGLDDDGFQKYMADPQGQKDLDGYLSALGMISTSAGDSAAATDVLLNGFNNDQMQALINAALGQ